MFYKHGHQIINTNKITHIECQDVNSIIVYFDNKDVIIQYYETADTCQKAYLELWEILRGC